VEHKHTIVVFQWRHVEQKFRPASQDILSANIVCLHASRLSPSSRSRIYIKICIRGKVCCFQPAVVARWSGDENLETYMWNTQAVILRWNWPERSFISSVKPRNNETSNAACPASHVALSAFEVNLRKVT